EGEELKKTHSLVPTVKPVRPSSLPGAENLSSCFRPRRKKERKKERNPILLSFPGRISSVRPKKQTKGHFGLVLYLR
ncbi:unnamed protein product, partial [Linum tenue]